MHEHLPIPPAPAMIGEVSTPPLPITRGGLTLHVPAGRVRRSTKGLRAVVRRATVRRAAVRRAVVRRAAVRGASISLTPVEPHPGTPQAPPTAEPSDLRTDDIKSDFTWRLL